MTTRFSIKILVIVIGVFVFGIGTFLIYSLAGLNAKHIVFAPPPTFVLHYGAALSELAQVSNNSKPTMQNTGAQIEKITANFETEKALVLAVFFDNKSPESLFQLFAHGDITQRVKIASAFSAVNIEFTHDEESGFPEKREQFWKTAEIHLPNIQNALFEALITSAEEHTTNHIPYTLAWMPGQGKQTIEILAWAAKHHPDWWVRRFSVFFVTDFGQNKTLVNAVLRSQTHDPDYRVRKKVLDLRVKHWFGG